MATETEDERQDDPVDNQPVTKAGMNEVMAEHTSAVKYYVDTAVDTLKCYVNTRVDVLTEEMDRQFEEVHGEIKGVRKEMNKRFDKVDKTLESIVKRMDENWGPRDNPTQTP